MDVRVLRYFLAVAREQTISGAAEVLHMTQPPLSKQLRELEEELGKQLFYRGKRRITLTKEGMLLRKRAGGNRLVGGKNQSRGQCLRRADHRRHSHRRGRDREYAPHCPGSGTGAAAAARDLCSLF